MRNINLKYIVVGFLMISGVMAICFDSLSRGFVTFAPYGIDEYVYLRDMQGSADDDSLLIGFFGGISIITGLILLFIKNITYVVRGGFLILILLFLLFLLTESDSIFRLVINTIQYDHNIYLILWCISIFLYVVFLSILNIRQGSRNSRE